MTKVISAKSLLPNLYENDSSSDDDDNEQEESMSIEDESQSAMTGHEDVVDDLTYDIKNLVACNYHPIRLNDNDDKENMLMTLTQRTTQLLVKRIFELPVERTDNGPLALLPEESFVYPREKPIPEAKAETRWEKFAKDKGILKKKRERMIFDETAEEWKPRHGYKRIKNGIEDIPIVEVKHGQDPYADPWEENRKEKKERVLKNQRNQDRNKMRALGKKKSYDPARIPGIPVDVDDQAKRRGKEGVRRTLQLVQHSTQSLGRFDEMRPNEPKRKIKGKKRTFKDNLQANDRESMKAQLRIVEDKVTKKAKGVTNSLKAYEGLIPDAPSNSFKAKKGKGKATKVKAGRKK